MKRVLLAVVTVAAKSRNSSHWSYRAIGSTPNSPPDAVATSAIQSHKVVRDSSTPGESPGKTRWGDQSIRPSLTGSSTRPSTVPKMRVSTATSRLAPSPSLRTSPLISQSSRSAVTYSARCPLPRPKSASCAYSVPLKIPLMRIVWF